MKCFSFVALLLLCSCGSEPSARDVDSTDDDIVCLAPAAHQPVTGPFARPADFDQSSCDPGSLADLDPSGTWFYEKDNAGIFSGNGPVQMKLTCEGDFSLSIGRTLESVVVEDRAYSEDGIFWRVERRFEDFDMTIVDAFNICGVSPEGALIGQAARCRFDSRGENCETAKLRMKRFERLAGEGLAEGLELVSEFAGEAGRWRQFFTANVRVHEGRAYVVLDEGGLQIVDVSDPAQPKALGGLDSREKEGFNDLKIVRGQGEELFALVASSSRGMVVVNVTDPTNPRDVIAVTPSGDPNEGIHTLFTETLGDKTLAYLADGVSNLVTIWDVSDPPVPVRLGSYRSADRDWSVHDLFVSEGRMYLNSTVGGMVIVDTQPNPANPQTIAHWAPEVPAYSHSNWVTKIDGRRISVHGDEGLGAHFKVVDVEPESTTFLQELGSYQTRPEVSAHNVMAFGDKAYAAYYQDGVRIIDLSDPTNPTLDAYYNTWQPETAPGGRFVGAVGIDVDLEAGLIYVADYPRGLLILRIVE